MSTRHFVLLATLACLTVATSSAHALTYSKNPDEGVDENAILATGSIEQDEAFRFQTYLSKLPSKPQTSVYLNTTGGSVQGAIAMGRIVFAAKIRTFVTTASARCISACTFIFLAGRDRETGKPYRVKGSNNAIGFHNFVPNLDDKTFAVKDVANVMSRAQSTIYDIATYYQEIDANLELLGLGLKQKDVYYLPNQDALRYGIHVLDANSKELIRSETFTRYLNP
jgi:hypothetical protein